MGERRNSIGLFKIMLFNDSRKVGLGAWIYFTGTPLFAFSMIYNALHPPLIGSFPIGITFEQYVILLGVATTLIGGGTLADKWMGKKADQNATPPS